MFTDTDTWIYGLHCLMLNSFRIYGRLHQHQPSLASARTINKKSLDWTGTQLFCRKCYIISWTKDSCMKVTLESLYTLLSWHQRTFIFIMQQTQNLSQMKKITILSKEFHKTNTYLRFWNGNKNM